MKADFSDAAASMTANPYAIQTRSFFELDTQVPIATVGGEHLSVRAGDLQGSTQAFIGVGTAFGDLLGEPVSSDEQEIYGIPTKFDGRSGDDTLYGGTGVDELHGGDGDDHLEGRFSDDFLIPGAGMDHVDGGDGNDTLVLDFAYMTENITLSLEPGTTLENDTYTNIEGFYAATGSGNDTIDAEMSPISNRIYAGAGDDTVTTGQGNDKIQGGTGHDVINANAGHDDVQGADGDDIIHGGTGKDTLDGGAGNDRLTVADGGDVIHGGAGDDILVGIAGVDDGDTFLIGGEGNDTFVIDVKEEAFSTFGFHGNLEAFSQFAGSIVGIVTPDEAAGVDYERMGIDIAFSASSALVSAVPIVGPVVGWAIESLGTFTNAHLDADEEAQERSDVGLKAENFKRALLESDPTAFGDVVFDFENRDTVIIEDFEVGVDRIILRVSS